ncbi:5086_t:CDS:2, partial [Racocetra persica]
LCWKAPSGQVNSQLPLAKSFSLRILPQRTQVILRAKPIKLPKVAYFHWIPGSLSFQKKAKASSKNTANEIAIMAC